MQKTGRNVAYQVKDGVLNIAISLDAATFKTAPPTKGKDGKPSGNVSLASTLGNVSIASGDKVIRLGVNCFTAA